jgi:hypothetical protein
MSFNRFIPFNTMNSPSESFQDQSTNKRKLNDFEELNNDVDLQMKRKRGRPSFWNNIKEKTNEDEKLLLTPQIIIKRQRRLKANDRERNRMKNLNKMLQLLKSLLPFELNNESSMDDRLTKIETLKMATCYIAQLTQLLKLSDQQETTGGSILSSPSSSTSSPSIQMNNNDIIKYEKFDNYYYNNHHHHPQQSPTSATSIMCQYYCQNNFFTPQTYYHPSFINGFHL